MVFRVFHTAYMYFSYTIPVSQYIITVIGRGGEDGADAIWGGIIYKYIEQSQKSLRGELKPPMGNLRVPHPLY